MGESIGAAFVIGAIVLFIYFNDPGFHAFVNLIFVCIGIGLSIWALFSFLKWREQYERNKPRLPSPPPPLATPAPPSVAIAPEEAARAAFERIASLVPYGPWHPLFSTVVDELARGEQIWTHSIDAQTKTIADALTPLAKQLPSINPSPLMAPLFSFIPNLTEIVQSIVHTILYRKYGEVPPDVHPAARDNFRKPCLAAIYYVIQGRVWDGKFRTKKGTWDGEPYEEDIEEYNPVSGPHPEQYLDGTPFARILDFPVPLSYTHKKRFEHTQIVGGSGAGKTTLLSHLLLHDLNNSPDPPGIVLIDPKRTVIDKLSRLALFDSKLKDRLILVSPEYAPAINIFDMSNRLSNVGAIESLVYLCSALASEFTVRQEGLAASIARLLLVFPQTLGRNATLHDFQDLLVDKFPSKYRAAVEGLRPNQRRFFEEGGFENPEYRDAKRQIRVRLDAMLNSDHLDSLFSSQKSAINIGAELQKGSIILVDTAEGLVGKRESDSFGFVFIAEVMRAIMERNALAPEARRPAFLYVDEAANFFKGDMGYFFTAARQCHVGGVFAFHTLAQTEQAGLRDALMASTATKLVSKRAVDDAPSFAYHMGFSSPTDFRAFLDGRPNYHFACSIAGVQDKAVSITAPFGEIDQEPKMSDAAYQQLIQRNRERVSGQQHQRPAAPPPPPRPPNDQDTREGVTMDDLSLADAYAQLALAIRRGDRKREAELQDHIDSFKKRTQEDDWRNKR